ncbi:hypothetical protein S101450_00438 [Komagataeibacter saccharivorans]|nr:hypothetical protein S101450_00438 [Komagataeibacter saccharivorans]
MSYDSTSPHPVGTCRPKVLSGVFYFITGTSARSAAEIIGINRNTATQFYRKLWEIIAGHNAPEEKIEVDESYFGGYSKDKRSRGAAGKVAVFGLLKRGGHVHAVMIPDAGSGKREAHVAHSKENTSRFNRLFRRVVRLPND